MKLARHPPLPRESTVLFNSSAFFAFFAAVYVVYLPLAGRRAQTWLLLVASYVFYGFWDWRFLALIAMSTLVDYGVALRLHAEQDPSARKLWMLLSVGVNLGVLGFFKYYNFFADSIATVLVQAGLPVEPLHLDIVLPVGISFYTFQTLSYTIDVYRRQLEPTRDLLVFATYVAFFPQLVAGPIERAERLLPQLEQPRTVRYEQLRDGAWLVFFGLFKKVAVADNLAPLVDPVFHADAELGAILTWIGVYAFAFQIYCDFSGYTDIARGIAKWLGVELALNFRRPYFATNPSAFWQRWHISLSQWLRDYLYIPLGGNRGGTWSTQRNLLITMLLGGLWHGPTWMFVAWGAVHGALLILHRAWTTLWPPQAFPVARAVLWPLRAFVLFQLVCLAWVFFRAEDFSVASAVFSELFSPDAMSEQAWTALSAAGFAIGPVLLLDAWAEVWERWGAPEASSEMGFLLAAPAPVRGLVYAGLAAILVIAGAPSGRAFLYFQF